MSSNTLPQPLQKNFPQRRQNAKMQTCHSWHCQLCKAPVRSKIRDCKPKAPREKGLSHISGLPSTPINVAMMGKKRVAGGTCCHGMGGGEGRQCCRDHSHQGRRAGRWGLAGSSGQVGGREGEGSMRRKGERWVGTEGLGGWLSQREWGPGGKRDFSSSW